MTKPTYEELEQLTADLQTQLSETLFTCEAMARAEFLRGQQYFKNLPSPLAQA
jgi:hypothetical protein